MTELDAFTRVGELISERAKPEDIPADLDGLPDSADRKAMTAAERDKLAGLPADAEANVQPDWNAASGDAQILNKPTLGTAATADATDFATAAQGAKADTLGAVTATGATPADARAAIGAGTASFTGAYDDLSGKPTLGTAAAADVGTSAGQVKPGDWKPAWADDIDGKPAVVAAGVDAKSARVAVGIPEEVADHLLSGEASGGLTWTAATTVVARALGWIVVTDPKYGVVGGNVGNQAPGIHAAAADAAAKGARSTLYFPADTAGYRVTEPVTIPGKVDLQMLAPIVYAGTAGTALTVGETGANRHAWARHTVRVAHAVEGSQSWNNPIVGVDFINHYWAQVTLAEARGFTTGARVTSKNSQGSAYNMFYLGRLGDNKCHLELDAHSGGWVNQNTFHGGSFQNTSASPAEDRVGVRITSSDGTYYCNANVWYTPSFEIDGSDDPFTGTCVEGVYAGPGNRFYDCRLERASATAIVLRNNSAPIRFTTTYSDPVGDPLPVGASELGTLAGSTVETHQNFVPANSTRLTFKAGDIHKRACFYNGSGFVNVPGLNWTTSASTPTDLRHSNIATTIGPDYLELPTNRALGRYFATDKVKTIVLMAGLANNVGGRLVVRAYDAAGAIITTAGTVRPDQGSPFTYTTAWGGAHAKGSDSIGPWAFTVSADTAYIWVGLQTAGMRIRSLAFYTASSSADVASWVPYYDDGATNMATTPPTAGTWEVGRRILNATPAVGQPQGWICTTAGTPGTWVPMPNL